MFPSSGKFKILHCPYHVEGTCGRIYCHYRHVKNKEDKLVEIAELQKLEKQICSALKIDQETFKIIVNETDDNVHEKLLNNKLKIRFPGNDNAIDNFHFPEALDDFTLSSTNSISNENSIIDFINLTDDDPPIDEGPLKQLLEDDAIQVSNSENCSKIERRHMIISCLEKLDSRRSCVQPKKLDDVLSSHAVPTSSQEMENTNEVATQPANSDSFSEQLDLKQEEETDYSDPEEDAEVDEILTQIELLKPQLFKTDMYMKDEPQEDALDSSNVKKLETLNFDSQASKTTSARPSNSDLVGRINLKSIEAINNEVTAGVVKPEMSFNVPCAPLVPEHDPIVEIAKIAEQNRLKNLFKSTICLNIDQFFDLSDACNVYGTEIFTLLEPLLKYLIEKLNPEFNFEKLQKFHSQNVSLSSSLPFVTSCGHMRQCIECHNILKAALARSNIEKCDKTTEMDSSLTDVPLREIEAGLYDITKEILALGIPAVASVEKKSVQCQTKSDSYHGSSHQSNSSSHKHKSRSSKDEKKHSHGSKLHHRSSRHSHSSSSSRSSKLSSHKPEKRKKDSESENSDQKCDKDMKSPRRENSKRRKRQTTDKLIGESKKIKTEPIKSKSSREMEVEISSDDDGDVFGGHISDRSSDSVSENESKSTNKDEVTVLSDSANTENEEISKVATDEFADKFPAVANKKRISLVTDGNSSSIYRKPIFKKNILSPSEVLFQRLQSRKAEETVENATNLNGKFRISQVSNVAQMLKAKEQLKQDMLKKPILLPPARTVAQSAQKGQRTAHIPVEPPKPKHITPLANNCRPTIKDFKSSHNLPNAVRQNGLDRLYNAFARKVPPEVASALALKQERTIHEKVTIQKIYMQSLAMAVHRISKEDPAKLTEKPSEYPLEINGFSVYNLLSKYILTYEEMEINGFPLKIAEKPGCCYISTKAIHYKSLMSKRNGDNFYCQQCKELFSVCPETGIPITPVTGCRFHSLRARKEPGRTRHELFYPCCNKGISESGCNSADHHTPDTTDDDCLEGFLETKEGSPGEEGKKKFYSLDCEMCYTTVGSELTRVTIIGHDCNIVYDSLVKPKNKVLDYCTKFSGITEEKLKNVTKTLEQVRQEIFKFIFKDTILIGHSLENDLKALKILHYKIVDTSVMYPHRDAPERKFPLKFLSSNVVQFLIQESEFGHDSMEDALACMKLVWKKVKEDARIHRPKTIINSPTKNILPVN